MVKKKVKIKKGEEKRLYSMYTSERDKRIPKDVIIFHTPPVFGWFAFWEDRWYGDWITVEENFPQKDLESVIEILTDQVKMTRDELTRRGKLAAETLKNGHTLHYIKKEDGKS